MIADMTDADLYKIDQMHPYSVHYDTCIKEKDCTVLINRNGF